VSWYLVALKKYAEFRGRSCRREFWTFYLTNIIAGNVLRLTGIAIGSNLPVMVFYLAIWLPLLAVSVRRVRDTGHSGWWVLVPFAILVFGFMPGTPGENAYGPDPKRAMASV
jgi:uncharacterized membrane protein YhaH (DUF805 family)